jgi:probable HAF family extracellular repeat protein
MKAKTLAWCLGLMLIAQAGLAQMYTVTDLTPSTDPKCSLTSAGVYYPTGVNDFGEVVGTCKFGHYPYYGFRTAPELPIDPSTDDLGTLGGAYTEADGVNLFGQAVGSSETPSAWHAFRTAANKSIDPATDDLGTLGGTWSWAYGVNVFGQAVGLAYTPGDAAYHAFRTRPNRAIRAATDDLGTLGGTYSQADGINALGQVVGQSYLDGDVAYHAFRTGPNRTIHPNTDDLGTLTGTWSHGSAINIFGFVVGWASLAGDTTFHAFRASPNRPIRPGTDDLGTLGGSDSQAYGINSFGQVVGWASTTGDAVSHGFLYSRGVMRDLNDLIPPGSTCEVNLATSINDAGQIAGTANCGGQSHAVLLIPVYRAFVQPPLHADGSSVFSAKRGTVPVKFKVTRGSEPTCTLPPASIAVTRATGTTLASLDENAYSTPADSGSNFRIDPTACQYIYNLGASALGAGTYRVDISIDGVMVGHAVFALR